MQWCGSREISVTDSGVSERHRARALRSDAGRSGDGCIMPAGGAVPDKAGTVARFIAQ